MRMAPLRGASVTARMLNVNALLDEQQKRRVVTHIKFRGVIGIVMLSATVSPVPEDIITSKD